VVQKHWAGGSDVRVSAAVQSVTGAVIVTPALVVFGGRFDVSAKLALSVGWLAWGMGIVTLLLLVYLLRGHAASTVSALLLCVPAVTAIASAPLLGEALHPASLVGMIVAMAGVGAVVRREAARAAEPVVGTDRAAARGSAGADRAAERGSVARVDRGPEAGRAADVAPDTRRRTPTPVPPGRAAPAGASSRSGR
jgi:hypothetical protein